MQNIFDKSLSPPIRQFIETWAKNQTLWQELTHAADSFFREALVDDKQLKYYIFSRAKEKKSILKGVARRESQRKEGLFTNEEEILNTMPDLAGIRILTPFPKDVNKVGTLLKEQFGENGVKETYWGLDENGRIVENEYGRFVGYRATHFHVKWKQPSDKYSSARLTKSEHDGWTVEVQVTTMLMNSWQEVQHDLIYKESKGPPSQDEKDIVMTINGMAHAGEVALEHLERVQQNRIQKDGRPFQHADELVTWLREKDRTDLLESEIAANNPAFKDTRIGSNVSAIYLAVLFDITKISTFASPNQLREALRKANPYGGLRPKLSLSSHDVESLAADISLWVIAKVCVEANGWKFTIEELGLGPQLSTRFTPLDPSSQAKAWAIVNAINLALSERSNIEVIGKEFHNQAIALCKKPEDIQLFNRALFSSVTKHTIGSDYQNLIDILWEGLYSNTRLFSLLQASMSMLAVDVVVVPKVEYAYGSRCVIWPGHWRGIGREEEWIASILRPSRESIVSFISTTASSITLLSEVKADNFPWGALDTNGDFFDKGGFTVHQWGTQLGVSELAVDEPRGKGADYLYDGPQFGTFARDNSWLGKAESL
jgi:ppGpp synthetase/RelA/SpoT-type nucleotidyltranferase